MKRSYAPAAMRIFAALLSVFIAVPPFQAHARNYEQDTENRSSFASVSQVGEIDTPQARLPAGPQIQNSLGASKANALVDSKFQDMKQTLASGQPLRTQDIKASFSRELDKIPSSQLSSAEKAELKKSFNTNVDNVQAMAKSGDAVAARAGLKSGDYTLVLSSFNDLSVKVDGGASGKTVDLKPMAMRGPQNAIQSSVADVKFTVPPGQSLSFNLTAASAQTNFTVVKGSVENKAYQGYAVSVTVEPTGLQSNAASMRSDLAAVGGTLSVVSNGAPATFTGTVQDSGNFTPSMTFTGNGPVAAPSLAVPVPGAGNSGEPTGDTAAPKFLPGVAPVGNAVFAAGGLTNFGNGGLNVVQAQAGKTVAVAVGDQTLNISGDSMMFGQLGSMKAGAEGVTVTNPNQVVMMLTPADFEANQPALAALGVQTNNPAVTSAISADAAQADTRGYAGISDRTHVLVDLRPQGQGQIQAVGFDTGELNQAKAELQSRGTETTAKAGNLDIGLGGHLPQAVAPIINNGGVAVVSGRHDGENFNTGVLNVGALNLPLKVSDSFVIATPGSIKASDGAASLANRGNSVLIISRGDFPKNERTLGNLGVRTADIKQAFAASDTGHVMIDFRPSNGATVRPLDLRVDSEQAFLDTVTHDLRTRL